MYYNKNYLFTHNIDWYACINGIWIYAASRGGLLPGVVDNESMLPKLQGICANLPDVINEEDIVINQELIRVRYRRAVSFYEQRLIDNQANGLDFQQFLQEYNIEEFGKQFSTLFVEMARKGFYSFVRVDIDNPFSNEYRLVASPKNGTPAHLSEIIHKPFNEAFVDDEYKDYIENITIRSENEVISFTSNLDVLF
jgi:hypothetical protein